MRVLFRTKPDDAVYLYFGSPRGSSLRHDLSLVAVLLIVISRLLPKASHAEAEHDRPAGLFGWMASASEPFASAKGDHPFKIISYLVRSPV